jgi:hypothetical protein
VEDLEDDSDKDEDGGWGVTTIEAAPKVPAIKSPERKEREKQQVRHSGRQTILLTL